MKTRPIIHNLKDYPTKMTKINNKFYKIIEIPENIIHGKMHKIDIRVQKLDLIFKLSNIRVDYIFSEKFSTIGKDIIFEKSSISHNNICTYIDDVLIYLKYGILIYAFYFNSMNTNCVIVWMLSELKNNYIPENTYGCICHVNNKFAYYDMCTLETVIFDVPTNTNYGLFLIEEQLIIMCIDENNTGQEYLMLDRFEHEIVNLLLCIKSTLDENIKPPKFIKKKIINAFYQDLIYKKD